MGKIFSDVVEQALEYVFYNERAQRGKEGFAMLEQASAGGDGDASCALARCLSGGQYIWAGHGFPCDDDRAEQLIRLSVEQGSAVGVLVSMRMGLMTPSLEKKMPFASLEEAFNIVLEKAEQGDAFCQYAIGNVYFWWDFIRIFGKGRDSFPSQNAYQAYVRENVVKCEDWFRKAFRGGMWLAGNNLRNYYLKGDSDVGIPPRPELAAGIWRQGAEYGYPVHQRFLADDLREAKDYEGAFKWYKTAAEGGELAAYYYVGHAYEEGEGVAKNEAEAVRWYQARLDHGMQVGCCNALGALYFYGKGVEQDYAKAFQLINWAYSQGNDWGIYYLGVMYFHGWGVQQDYAKAREILEKVTWNNHKVHYCLGVIYGNALGGAAEDIPKAVEHLQKATSVPEAKEELLKYRKTLFGKWVGR